MRTVRNSGFGTVDITMLDIDSDLAKDPRRVGGCGEEVTESPVEHTGT